MRIFRPAQRQQTSTDVEAQKERIDWGLQQAPLIVGDTWYLVEMVWFRQWQKYVGFDIPDACSVGKMEAHPGCIDKSPLFKSGGSGHLCEELIDDLDYVLFPEEAWLDLESWYGLADDSHRIARKVIEVGMFVKHHKVEVFLLELKLSQHSDPQTIVPKQFSRADTVGKLEETTRNVFKIPQNIEVKLWNRYMSNTFEHLSKPENSLHDAGLFQGQFIVIEQRNADGSWPRQMKPK